MTDWTEAQKWELDWHGDCSNDYNEQTKQYIYAKHMGLDEFATNWYGRRGWDFGDRSVVDIGGGPCSILLKSKAARRVVIDPCEYPNWVKERYEECGIKLWPEKAETPIGATFDLALMYNVLQHVDSPQQIIENVKAACRELRIFEWIDTGTSEGHLHNLTAQWLDEMIGGQGCVRDLDEYPCVGKAYVGIFPL